jgi:hypothetical protein
MLCTGDSDLEAVSVSLGQVLFFRFSVCPHASTTSALFSHSRLYTCAVQGVRADLRAVASCKSPRLHATSTSGHVAFVDRGRPPTREGAFHALVNLLWHPFARFDHRRKMVSILARVCPAMLVYTDTIADEHITPFTGGLCSLEVPHSSPNPRKRSLSHSTS